MMDRVKVYIYFMLKRLTTNEFIEKSIIKHEYKYDYTLVDYKNAKIKVILTCKNNHKFEINPQKHLLGSGCRKCFTDSRRLDTDTFIARSKEIHKDLYDYSKTKYINDITEVLINCKEHGEFYQLPSVHYRSGCPKCGIIKRSNSRKNDNVELIYKFSEKHSNKYDYSKVDYIKMRDKVIIKCRKHNLEFLQTPEKHLSSKTGGCPECNTIGKGRLTNKSFIERSKEKHLDKYDYSKVDYVKSNVKVILVCEKHGNFEITPNSHLRGTGCPICGRNGGIKENIWLDTFNIPKNLRQYKIDNFYVDGIDLENNIIYEFNGDYWHGNPNIYNKDDMNKSCNKSFGELYQKTIKREEYLKSIGYKVVSIWEDDFKKNKY